MTTAAPTTRNNHTEESPELGEAWARLFSAAWDAYETLMQRRAAAASTANTAANNDNNKNEHTR